MVENASLDDRGEYKCIGHNAAMEYTNMEPAKDVSYVRVKGKKEDCHLKWCNELKCSIDDIDVVFFVLFFVLGHVCRQTCRLVAFFGNLRRSSHTMHHNTDI